MPTSKEGLCMYISGEYKKRNLDSRPGIQRKNRTLSYPPKHRSWVLKLVSLDAGHIVNLIPYDITN